MDSLKLENLYSKIFYNAVVAIGVTDLQGRYLMVNPTWCEWMGYSKEEAINLYINDVTPREDWETSTSSLHFLPEHKGQTIHKQRRYKRKDGSIFWADLNASAISDADGKPLGIVGIFVNIDKQVTADQIQRKLMDDMEELNLELSQANEDLKQMARHDALTGLYNRRVLEEIIFNESERSRRTARGFGIAMADIDNFKKINDSYGHEAGDLVLKELATILKNSIRSTDTVGRWGGEEFLFVFTETSCQGAMIVIERIRHSVEKSIISYRGQQIRFTITIGLSYHKGDDGAREMIREADEALYQGKNSGKNRVVCYQDFCTEEKS